MGEFCIKECGEFLLIIFSCIFYFIVWINSTSYGIRWGSCGGGISSAGQRGQHGVCCELGTMEMGKSLLANHLFFSHCILKKGDTALCAAAGRGRVKVVSLLLDRGANMETADNVS